MCDEQQIQGGRSFSSTARPARFYGYNIDTMLEVRLSNRIRYGYNADDRYATVAVQ